MKFDLESLTIGTLIDLEEHAGISLSDLQNLDPDNLSARTIGAVRFMQLRATYPDATWDDAKATPLGGMADALEIESDPE